MATTHSLPFKTLEAMLRKTTEYFAHAVTRPDAAPPQWSDTEWRIGKAALSLQGMSVPIADTSPWRGPDNWEDHQREQIRQALLRYERVAELLLQLDAAAQRERVSFVALKGAALYRLGVYRPGRRSMGDIDLLVQSEAGLISITGTEDRAYTIGGHPNRVEQGVLFFAKDPGAGDKSRQPCLADRAYIYL